MTDEREIAKTARDAFVHGMGMMRDGKHVPLGNVYMTAKEAAAEDLVKRLRLYASRLNEVFEPSLAQPYVDAADCIEQLISDNKKLRNGGGARLVRSVRTLLLEKEMFDVQGGPSQEAWQELNAAYIALAGEKTNEP